MNQPKRAQVAAMTTLAGARRPHDHDTREPAPPLTAIDYDTVVQDLREQIPAGHDLLWVRRSGGR